MGGAGGGRTRPGEGLQVRIPAAQAESLRGGEVTGKACTTEEEFRKRERGEGQEDTPTLTLTLTLPPTDRFALAESPRGICPQDRMHEVTWHREQLSSSTGALGVSC